VVTAVMMIEEMTVAMMIEEVVVTAAMMIEEMIAEIATKLDIT
jgi:hypothetical protein